MNPRRDRSSSSLGQDSPVPPAINSHFANCGSLAPRKRSWSEMFDRTTWPLFNTSRSRSRDLSKYTSLIRRPCSCTSKSIGSVGRLFATLFLEVLLPGFEDGMSMLFQQLSYLAQLAHFEPNRVFLLQLGVQSPLGFCIALDHMYVWRFMIFVAIELEFEAERGEYQGHPFHKTKLPLKYIAKFQPIGTGYGPTPRTTSPGTEWAPSRSAWGPSPW